MATFRGYTGSTVPTITTSPVKDGRACIKANAYTSTPNLDGTPITGRVVFAFWFRYAGNPTGYAEICWIGSTSYYYEAHLDIGSDKLLTLNRYNGNILGTGITPISADTWHFIELRYRLNNSISANDSSYSVNGISRFSVQSASTGTTSHYFDSLVIYDATGSRWNADTFEGQHRFQFLSPTGNGATNDFVGSDADSTDNYLHVDDNPHDGNTSYTEASGIGDIDLYEHLDISGTPPAILAVQSYNVLQKTDGGAKTARLVCNSSGINYFGSGITAANGQYIDNWYIWENDPNTGAQWTQSNLDAAQFGIEVES
jgi:hypothetical protein